MNYAVNNKYMSSNITSCLYLIFKTCQVRSLPFKTVYPFCSWKVMEMRKHHSQWHNLQWLDKGTIYIYWTKMKILHFY